MEEQTSYTQYLADNNIFLYSMEKAEYKCTCKLLIKLLTLLEIYPIKK